MPVIVWRWRPPLRLDAQVQRVSTLTLVRAALAQMELGLRWLADTDSRRWAPRHNELARTARGSQTLQRKMEGNVKKADFTITSIAAAAGGAAVGGQFGGLVWALFGGAVGFIIGLLASKT